MRHFIICQLQINMRGVDFYFREQGMAVVKCKMVYYRLQGNTFHHVRVTLNLLEQQFC